MNLVLDTLRSRRSFMQLGHALGLLATAVFVGLTTSDQAWLGGALAATVLLIFEFLVTAVDPKEKRLRALAPAAFPFKNLSEGDRDFLQRSLMRIPQDSAMRAYTGWAAVCGLLLILEKTGSLNSASWGMAALLLGGIVSALCQYLGNSAMGRRVAPFYYFKEDPVDGLSKHLPSFRRRLWILMLGPILLLLGPVFLLGGRRTAMADLWVAAWAIAASLAGLRVFQDLVVAPIEDLGSALGRFGEGDFSALLDVTSGDALGLTTNRYNKALRKIDRRFFVRENFGHMVVGDRAEALFEGGLKLDGEEREVGVLACRVSGEGLTLAAFNKFCGTVAESVDKHGGSLDEIGQGCVVALFNAPLKIENAEAEALEAAKEVKERLEVFKAQQRMQAGLSLQCGVGFAFGKAVLGLAGPKARQRYTALGSVVEQARSQSLL